MCEVGAGCPGRHSQQEEHSAWYIGALSKYLWSKWPPGSEAEGWTGLKKGSSETSSLSS